jgi:hypothetical protein
MSTYMAKRLFILVIVVSVAAVLVTFMMTRSNVDTVKPANAEPINMETTTTTENSQEQPQQPQQPETPAEPEVPQAQESTVNAEIYESEDHSVIICYDKTTGEILWERRTDANAKEANSEESAPETVETVEEAPVVETAEDATESADLQALIDAGWADPQEVTETQETENQEPEVPEAVAKEPEVQETENQEAQVAVVVVEQPQVEAEQIDSEEIEEETIIEETQEEEQVGLVADQTYVTKANLEMYPGSSYSNHVNLSAGSTIKVVRVDGEFTMVQATFTDQYRSAEVIAFINTVELLGAI